MHKIQGAPDSVNVPESNNNNGVQKSLLVE